MPLYDGTLGTNGGPRIDEHAACAPSRRHAHPGSLRRGQRERERVRARVSRRWRHHRPRAHVRLPRRPSRREQRGAVITDVAGTGAGTGGNFAGKVAVVTGAASGIGRASARLFAARGAGVVVADIDETGGAETAELVRKNGGRAVFQATDVADPAAVERMVRARRGRVRSARLRAQQRGHRRGRRARSPTTRSRSGTGASTSCSTACSSACGSRSPRSSRAAVAPSSTPRPARG